jgi:hypothetical protein
MRLSLLLPFLFASLSAGAAMVTLNDGSSLSGELKEQANGDVIVGTGAGEITVSKDKIKSIMKDGTPSSAPEGDMSYVNKVLERRKKFGNDDGIPRTENIHQQQIQFTVGQLMNVGDAFLVKDSAGATILNAADISGLSFGLSWAHSYTDYVALEVWGDYSGVAKDFSLLGASSSYKLQRYDVALGPKVQFAKHLGAVEGGMEIIPNVSLSPMWSGANGSVSNDAGSTSFNSSSIGAALSAGLDLQFGGALVSVKGRYLMTADVTGSLKNSNTSAFLPQLGVGWAF